MPLGATVKKHCRKGESPGTGRSERHWGQFMSLLKPANIPEKVLTHLHKESPFFWAVRDELLPLASVDLPV